MQRLVHGHDDKVLGEQVDERRPLLHASVRVIRVVRLAETWRRTRQLAIQDACLPAGTHRRMADSSVSSFLKKKQLKKWNLRCARKRIRRMRVMR